MKRLSTASYSGKRSGYFHLCQLYGIRQNDEFIRQLTILFKGLKIRITKEKQEGGGKITTGKASLSFGLYHQLSEYMLQDTRLEKVFAHAFLTATWNLICCVTNTCTIHLHYMDWKNDCLCIYVAHMKNDQGGDGNVTPVVSIWFVQFCL
jgi:hypothetical protein